MGRILDGYPWWSQLRDPFGNTGRPDVFAATDCGEEVASIWIAGKTGKYTDAGDLRLGLPGIRQDGRTTPFDVAWLLQRHGVSAAPNVWGRDVIKSRLHAAIDGSNPVGLLGSWLGSAVLHWYLGIGYGNNALVAMDPWRGVPVVVGWDVVHSLATGDVVQHV